MIKKKICLKCGIEKPLSDFWKDKRGKFGVKGRCKECRNRQRREEYKINPEKFKKNQKKFEKSEKGQAYIKKYKTEGKQAAALRKHDLKRNYGLTLADYDNMLEEQNGCCVICGKDESENGRRLNIDHDHKDGRIRGLLCNWCNLRLGWFEKNEKNIIDYLSR